MGVCVKAASAFNSSLKCLGFKSDYLTCVKMSGKLQILYQLCLPSSDGYLVEQRKLNCIRVDEAVGRECVPIPRYCHTDVWTINMYIYNLYYISKYVHLHLNTFLFIITLFVLNKDTI